MYCIILEECFPFFRGKKVEKKIYLFTDLGSPFGKDQLDLIINGLKDMEAQFVLV